MKMKNQKNIAIFIFCLMLYFINSCKKDEVVENQNMFIPEISTIEVTNITETTAKSGGEIISTGGASITSCGVCWAKHQTPTINDNKIEADKTLSNFSSNISNLEENTTYYVRAFAANSVGIAYGASFPFKTLEHINGVTDIDGNIYPTITIGEQEWMATNLRTKTLNSGIAIENITNNSDWLNASNSAYCWKNNDETNADLYGAFYNWNAVSTGNLCPAGWHVPDNDDWIKLVDFLTFDGYLENEAIAIKSKNGWNDGGNGADIYGFNALPAGNRASTNGEFENEGNIGYWWSSTPYSNNCCSWFMYLASYNQNIELYYSFTNAGYNVRCIKNAK